MRTYHNNADIEEVARVLEWMIRNVDRLMPSNGICFHVHTSVCRKEIAITSILDTLIAGFLKEYPPEHEFPSPMLYPVGGRYEYNTNGNLWHNPRRLQLLDYMVNNVRKLKYPTMEFIQ